MSDSGGTTRAEQARLRAYAEMAERIREDRAAGRKRWRGSAAALRWYAMTREAWASPKAITMRDEGSGVPSRGSENPARRRFAAVAWGVELADRDDAARHPEKRAPVLRWVLEHFGAGRAAAWMAEETKGRRVEWTEMEILNRLHRFCRVVRDHLRGGGWLEGGEDEG